MTQTIKIPDNAIADASQLFVKVYPGVFSQVLEGVDGMLRMPGGCFEQTSSSAYPNMLVVDYIKKTHLASPALMMKAEQYLNVGYQRLLTFERPGGGFDWWGSGEPLIWLSAYGLQEFNDMAKVYPIDRGVIDRTQDWLMKQQDGRRHLVEDRRHPQRQHRAHGRSETAADQLRHLVAAGQRPARIAELKKSIDYIRDQRAEGQTTPTSWPWPPTPWPRGTPRTTARSRPCKKVLDKLEKQKQEKPEWKAMQLPGRRASR